MTRTIGFPSSQRIADAGGSRLGLDFSVTSTRPIPITPTPANTYANSSAVYANATGFKAAMLSIEQQITALGG